LSEPPAIKMPHEPRPTSPTFATKTAAMRIANPIYDAVFKYLLEDMDIAREMLSVILGEEIETLQVRPQETVAHTPETLITVLRYDFTAVFRNRQGQHKKALIELQKSKHLLDIMRFRRYLGENYRKGDPLPPEEGEAQGKPVPLDIVTIYFLGFKLNNVPYAVLRSSNCYQDVLTGQYLTEPVQEPFVNLLDHEAYFIQIPRLGAQLQSRLQAVLSVFDQSHLTDDAYELDYAAEASDDPLVAKMLRRLHFARADEQLRRQMEIEDEVESVVLGMTRKLAEKDKAMAEKDKAMAEKDKAMAEKDKAMAEKDRAMQEKDRAIAALTERLRRLGIDPEAP
jgi:hypothetical protein